MVRAWKMDCSDSDQRLEHMRDPAEFVTLEEIEKRTGVLYWHIDVDNLDNEETLKQVRKDRGYNYEDQVKITEAMENYEQKIKMFFEEHLHTDEEIRLIVDGSGYFDIRDSDNEWIRIEMVKGDMIVLPAGIFHRFTLDTKNFIVARRYFVGEPVWTAFNISEETKQMKAHKDYLSSMKQEVPAI